MASFTFYTSSKSRRSFCPILYKQWATLYNSEMHFIQLGVCRYIIWFFLSAQQPSQWPMTSSFRRFIDHTQRRTIFVRIPLDEWSARQRDLYLTTQNTHNRQTSMPSVGFEPTISAGERPRTHALNRAATGISVVNYGNLTLYRRSADRFI